jgi:hypothetical protein
MPASKAEQDRARERRKQNIALRLAGAGWQQIADQLGYASRGAACEDYRRATAQSKAELDRSVEELRREDVDRVERLLLAYWPQAVAGNQRAGEFALKLLERRARLLQLDAPTQHEVITVSAVEREIARLEEELGVRARNVAKKAEA